MNFLHFNDKKCNLCGECIEKCPFDALKMEEKGIELNDACRMCGICVRVCQEEAISFEQKMDSLDKSQWRDILVYIELDHEGIHPVSFELIGEAHKLAKKVGYQVHAVIVGSQNLQAYSQVVLEYGVKKVYSYEHHGFNGFKADSYTDAVADCITLVKPSIVLIGGTALGRSLAPRLSTRFHTGLTADCTQLDIRENTDLVQIRPAFGGNVMAQILVEHARPQFATVRYKVMDKAEKAKRLDGEIIKIDVTDDLARSRIKVNEIIKIKKQKQIEEEEILVVAGRGVKDEKGIEIVAQLAEALGGQIAYTRPMVEAGYGSTSTQIGLSGRTVKPKLIITCGVSGSIQFATSMQSSECIIAINQDPEALIFNIAHYCIQDDLYEIVPRLIDRIKNHKEDFIHAFSIS